MYVYKQYITSIIVQSKIYVTNPIYASVDVINSNKYF